MQTAKQPPEEENQSIVPDLLSPVLPQQVTEHLQEQVSALEDQKVN